MSIFDLPIETDERIKNKKQAMIFSDRIVCHPDLKKKLLEGFAGAKAQIAKTSIALEKMAEVGKHSAEAAAELKKRIDKIDMRDIAEQEEEEKGADEASDLEKAIIGPTPKG